MELLLGRLVYPPTSAKKEARLTLLHMACLPTPESLISQITLYPLGRDISLGASGPGLRQHRKFTWYQAHICTC